MTNRRIKKWVKSFLVDYLFHSLALVIFFVGFGVGIARLSVWPAVIGLAAAIVVAAIPACFVGDQ
jgi:hypothetical protein